MPSNDRYSNGSNSNQPTITRTVTKSVVPVGSTDLVDPDVVFTKKHEEWTTSKRVVNHKTKQVETRVQRQLVLEDGRVIADSGPQVTTKTKEDVRVEESENTEHKSTGDDPPGPGYELIPGSAKVISEKTESNQTMTETREENRQMHDENIRDLSGEEIHQRTIISPDDPSFGNSFGEFPGKLTHYSSRSQKIVDKDEVKEVSELKDGEVSTETTRTHHHEEAYDDEVPEEDAEEGMVPERSGETSRTIQYYTDPKEFQEVSDRLQEESRRSRLINHRQNGTEFPAVTHRWSDDRYGGQKEITNDLRGESTRTRSGGNRITIEMSGNRSSPSDLSPRGTMIKDRSRESTLRNKASSSSWRNGTSPSPPYPPSTPVHNTTLGRSTASPFEVSSSSGSSRSKTPVKTFYLGEDNTYQRDHISSWKKKNNNSFTDGMSSAYSVGDTNSLGRSNLSGHYGERSDSFCRIPRSKINEPIRYDAFNNGAVYSKINRVKTDKNVQVSMSDDDDDDRSTLKRRGYNSSTLNRERSLSPPHLGSSRNTTTLPRTIKITQEPAKSPYSTNSLSHSKYYKSTDSLHSPGYSSYYSSNDYGSSNSYRNSSPIYNNGSFHKETRNNDVYRRNDWGSSNYNDTYNTNSKNRTHEIKIHKTNSHDVLTNGSSRRIKTESPNWYSSSSLKTRKIPTSPPESGYQSPFPPTPPSSPPPRVIKVLNSDHYGSSSSMSPPDSPIHNSTASIRKKASFPSGTASRSKSSGDLRMPLFSPEAFSPLASPLELKTVGNKSDPKKYYRVKPGQDGQSVVVQVRDWSKR
ncbi:uncharacterized protein NPIL_528331 [Nephila pilipes]|uniref:Uncharacterized protein n=1 Tax=Nephila pilipes TaxID=299642 RepID=A0A8X6TQY7_NEPPI|nr:uncharacterized protein NPIL_528331 [Nephila pilipes]